MRAGYSGAVMATTSLEEDLSLAARTRYEGVEARVPKLWAHLERHGLTALRLLLGRYRLPVWSLAPIPDVTFLALIPLGLVRASIRTVRQGGAVVESVGRRSGALALDNFHFHAGGFTLEDLQRCRPQGIALLRIADAPDRPRRELREHHWLLPGEGAVPPQAIASILRRLGADPPTLVHVPFVGSAGEAEGWARRLKERTLAALSDPVVSRC